MRQHALTHKNSERSNSPNSSNTNSDNEQTSQADKNRDNDMNDQSDEETGPNNETANDDYRDLRELLEVANQKLGIGELKKSTGNPNADLMMRFYTHLLKLKKKGYQSLLVLVEDGFPAHMSEEDYKSAYNMLILAQLKLGFAQKT